MYGTPPIDTTAATSLSLIGLICHCNQPNLHSFRVNGQVTSRLTAIAVQVMAADILAK
jgi:hypothetical protein